MFVVTGGTAELDVYVANDPEDRLLHTWEWDENGDPISPYQPERVRRAPRAVVIPYYDGGPLEQTLRACLVTPSKRHVPYPRQSGLAWWYGHDGFYLEDSRESTAWVFVENCWPVYMDWTAGLSHAQLTGVFEVSEPILPLPWQRLASGVAVLYPSSRPWDKFVAAGVECAYFDVTEEEAPELDHSWRNTIGGRTTLDKMEYIPSPLIQSVDNARRQVTDADRLMVFRQLLLLYEMTHDHWDRDKNIPGEEITFREAYEQNTRLLRGRIDALEAKVGK